MIGIYKITNLINQKSYIGQAVDIESRFRQHKTTAYNEKSHNYEYPLYRAIRKYGLENFSFEVLEECLRSDLNQKEKYWVAKYDTYFNGYNQTLGGDGGIVAPKEKIIGVITDLKTTDLYHREIAEKWEISIEMVQGINTGRYWYQDQEVYPLQTKHKSKSFHIDQDGYHTQRQVYYCAKCGCEITRKATLCADCNKIESRKVDRPSKEELYKFLINNSGNFTLAGKTYGVTDNSVRKWCKAYDIPYHSANYRPEKKINPNAGRTKSKAVAQIDINTGAIIATYPSTGAAGRGIGKANGSSHIGAVCNGKRKIAYGYYWKFIDSE